MFFLVLNIGYEESNYCILYLCNLLKCNFWFISNDFYFYNYIVFNECYG